MNNVFAFVAIYRKSLIVTNSVCKAHRHEYIKQHS